ncbi:MAG: hypothetical protein CVU56_07230 [Deltaproteobacteria bacterium HGW-Deltaproteobacteria-14]|jgi:hypothetical protein|nr:MAG: hypothetical protein CVU56_07230 [Deltaproteobacteria bacterium HGW-Deltaproteobacteria-14]
MLFLGTMVYRPASAYIIVPILMRSLRAASVERLAHPTAELASSPRGGNPLRETFQAALRSLSPAAFGAPAGAGAV